MYPKALHSRCDKWHKKEEKASSRCPIAPCSRIIVTLEKEWKRLHVGFHLAPKWMPRRLPSELFNSNIKIDPNTRCKNSNTEF